MSVSKSNDYRKQGGFSTKGLYISWKLGQPLFEVHYPDWVDGVRKYRVKKFAVKAEAVAWATARDIEIQNRGKSPSTMLDAEEEAAVALFRKKQPNMSLAGFIRRFLEHVSTDFSESTVRQVFDAHLSNLVERRKEQGTTSTYIDDETARANKICKDFGRRIASSLTIAEVRNWILNLKNRKGEEASFATKQGYYSIIKRAFNLAKLSNLVGMEPLKKKRIVDAEEANKKKKLYSVDDIRKMLEYFRANRPDCLAPLAFAVFTGSRVSEVFGACQQKGIKGRLLGCTPKWKDLLPLLENDKEESQIVFFCPKRQKRKTVTIYPVLKKWLKLAIKLNGDPDPDGVICGNKSAYIVNKTIKQSGVDFNENGLRHSHITYQIHRCQSLAKVAIEHGNTEEVIMKNYYEGAIEEESKKFFKLFPKR